MESQKFYVVGSTHIDLAWKKDEAEMAEMLDIFVMRLLDTLSGITFYMCQFRAGWYITA